MKNKHLFVGKVMKELVDNALSIIEQEQDTLCHSCHEPDCDNLYGCPEHCCPDNKSTETAITWWLAEELYNMYSAIEEEDIYQFNLSREIIIVLRDIPYCHRENEQNNLTFKSATTVLSEVYNLRAAGYWGEDNE